MRVIGIDFATSPTRTAPMFVVSGEFDGDVLNLDRVESHSTNVLAEMLKRSGQWALGLDVPFSLPDEFLSSRGWSLDWEEYVRHVGELSWGQLKAEIHLFRNERPEGAKDVYRPCDRAARSLSPIKTARPPLARMFQVAAPILAASDCEVLPFRPGNSNRTAVEVYPKLIAQRLVRRPYKSATPGATAAVRQQMIGDLVAGQLANCLGFQVQLADDVRAQALQNEPGEAIDSVFSAVEAAWSFRNRDHNWGIPSDSVSKSGWIVDPELVSLTDQAAVTAAISTRTPKLPALVPRFHRALVYAAEVHAKQKRKGTEIPYVSHLLIVAGQVLEFGGDEDEAIAGLLHDAVEDAGGQPRLQDIRQKFGSKVAEIVEACTDADILPKPPWRTRKEQYIAHLTRTSVSARLVSGADKLANLRSILRDYRSIGEDLWDRFNGGREGTLWYYRSLVGVFESFGPPALAIELRASLAELDRLMAQR